VADLGGEELLGARAGGVQGGVLAIGRQPVDVLVDVVVGGVGLGATVGAQERLSAVAVAGAGHADDGWGWGGGVERGSGGRSWLSRGCSTSSDSRRQDILLWRSCCASPWLCDLF